VRVLHPPRPSGGSGRHGRATEGDQEEPEEADADSISATHLRQIANIATLSAK
jgi:hypothetical protein